MEWIREHISKMPSFNYLNAHLTAIENAVETRIKTMCNFSIW